MKTVHYLSLTVIEDAIVLKCTCGYHELIGHQCTVGLVAALSNAHGRDSLSRVEGQVVTTSSTTVADS